VGADRPGAPARDDAAGDPAKPLTPAERAALDVVFASVLPGRRRAHRWSRCISSRARASWGSRRRR
jgi:hypothetical protein